MFIRRLSKATQKLRRKNVFPTSARDGFFSNSYRQIHSTDWRRKLSFYKTAQLKIAIYSIQILYETCARLLFTREKYAYMISSNFLDVSPRLCRTYWHNFLRYFALFSATGNLWQKTKTWKAIRLDWFSLRQPIWYNCTLSLVLPRSWFYSI